MNKAKFQRLTALILCIIFVVGCFTVNSAAADGAGATGNGNSTATNDSSSSSSSFDTKEMLELIDSMSYNEYNAEYGHVSGAKKEHETKVDIFNDIVADKTDIAIKIENTEEGNKAVFTPSTGKITWKVTVPTTARYTITIDYFAPNDGKVNAIERIFRIDDKVPFKEARYLTIKKNWVSDYIDATYNGEESKASVKAALEKAGLECYDKDGKLYVKYPAAWTSAIIKACDEYEIRFFRNDYYKNELRPAAVQTATHGYYTLCDASGYYTENFEFYLEAGEHTISLEGKNADLAIYGITLGEAEDLPTYKEYLAALGTLQNKKGSGSVKIEAEYINASSDKTVYAIEDGADALTYPNDPSRTMLNTVGGEKWQTAGQWVTYSFKVDASGMYDIVTRYRQNFLDGMFVNRALYIYSDSSVAEGAPGYYNGAPFKEARALTYNYGDEWQVTKAASGQQSFKFYFEKGVTYTIKLEVTLGEMGDVIRIVQDALNSINDDYLSIIQLTGATPDNYRDYGFSRIMPDVLIDMVKQAKILNNEDSKAPGVAQTLTKLAGQKSSNVGTLQKVSDLLLKMGRDEDEIAKSLERLKSYIGTLGTFLSDAKTQPLQVDYILIQPVDSEVPKAKAGFFASLWHEICRFFYSFFRNYDNVGVMQKPTGDGLEVWLATGRDQAQVKRSLVNDSFTAKTGIGVELKLVAGGTLLPSILAQKGPDVYHGLGQGDVINYAIRTAILPVYSENPVHYNKTKAEESNKTYITIKPADFIEARKSFNDSAMIVLGMEDSEGYMNYYGLPEAQGFSMMFVRVDILAQLGIEVPETWDDIMEAIPHLQARNMEIGLTTDTNIHLYQMGGTLFADNGMRINLDSQVGLAAFKKMCELFTKYSFPYTYDAANRFRTGEMPILIGDYTGLYNQLKVFATEIEGLWAMVHVPGVAQYDENGDPILDENGKQVINYSAISSVSASVLVRGSEDKMNNAWTYIKWFTGEECQADYASEMVAIMGPSAKYNTANMNALKNLPWSTEELAMIEDQFAHLASVPNYPGAYIIDRYTNFAFLAAYNDGEDPTQALLSYISMINKEITRKRAEFDLETLEKGETLASKRLNQAKEAADKLSDKDLADRIKSVIRGQDEVALRTLSEEILAMKGVSEASIPRISTGPDIDDFNKNQLLHYIGIALANAADALASYR